MAFTQKKFSQLSPNNQIKKTLYAVNEYLHSNQNIDYIIHLITWLNQFQGRSIPLPQNKRDWQILHSQLMQILGLENPYLEENPFDEPCKERTTIPVKVLLDNIRSPFNVGSIFRSAECFGIEELLLCGITPNPVNNHKIAKTAKQAQIPFQSYNNSIEALMNIDKNYKIYSLEKTSNSNPMNKVILEFPCVLILGNEEFGIDQKLLDKSEKIIHLTMLGTKNSINVSVAAGIAFHHISAHFI